MSGSRTSVLCSCGVGFSTFTITALAESAKLREDTLLPNWALGHGTASATRSGTVTIVSLDEDLWLLEATLFFALCLPWHTAGGGILVLVFLVTFPAAAAVEEVVLVVGPVGVCGGSCSVSPVRGWFQALIFITLLLVHSSGPQISTFSWSNCYSVSVHYSGRLRPVNGRFCIPSRLPPGLLPDHQVLMFLRRNGLRFSLSNNTLSLLFVNFYQQVLESFCSALHLSSPRSLVSYCCSARR